MGGFKGQGVGAWQVGKVPKHINHHAPLQSGTAETYWQPYCLLEHTLLTPCMCADTPRHHPPVSNPSRDHAANISNSCLRSMAPPAGAAGSPDRALRLRICPSRGAPESNDLLLFDWSSAALLGASLDTGADSAATSCPAELRMTEHRQ